GARAGGVLVLHVGVVGADDRFLAVEVVVGGAEREIGAAGDVANGGLVEAALAEEAQRRLEDLAPRFLAGRALGDGAGRVFEHVQRVESPIRTVKSYFEHVPIRRELWLRWRLRDRDRAHMRAPVRRVRAR